MVSVVPVCGSSLVMTLTPNPPSNRTSSTILLPMQIEITGMCLSMASVAVISSSVVRVLLGCVTTSVSRERTNSMSDGERLNRSHMVTYSLWFWILSKTR